MVVYVFCVISKSKAQLCLLLYVLLFVTLEYVFFFINRKKRVTDGWLSGESEKKREREGRARLFIIIL